MTPDERTQLINATREVLELAEVKPHLIRETTVINAKSLLDRLIGQALTDACC